MPGGKCDVDIVARVNVGVVSREMRVFGEKFRSIFYEGRNIQLNVQTFFIDFDNKKKLHMVSFLMFIFYGNKQSNLYFISFP